MAEDILLYKNSMDRSLNCRARSEKFWFKVFLSLHSSKSTLFYSNACDKVQIWREGCKYWAAVSPRKLMPVPAIVTSLCTIFDRFLIFFYIWSRTILWPQLPKSLCRQNLCAVEMKWEPEIKFCSPNPSHITIEPSPHFREQLVRQFWSHPIEHSFVLWCNNALAFAGGNLVIGGSMEHFLFLHIFLRLRSGAILWQSHHRVFEWSYQWSGTVDHLLIHQINPREQFLDFWTDENIPVVK